MLIDDDQGLTLLHSSAYYGKIKPMRTLVEHFGADVSYPDYRGQTPLHIATLTGNIETAIYLIDMKKQGLVEAKDNALMTALMNSVVACNDYVFIYLYFKFRCDTNTLDFNGNTLLHLAAQSNSMNIARLLRHLYKTDLKQDYLKTIQG